MIEAPAKQIVVPRGQNKPRSGERIRSADQRFEVLITFADRMGEETDLSGVASNALKMLDHNGGLLPNGVFKYGATIETMDAATQSIAGVTICFGRWPYIITSKPQAKRRTLHHRQRLACHKA